MYSLKFSHCLSNYVCWISLCFSNVSFSASLCSLKTSKTTEDVICNSTARELFVRYGITTSREIKDIHKTPKTQWNRETLPLDNNESDHESDG